MSHSAGKPAGSRKWLVTQYPERPGCFIQLGSILRDPYEVEEALTRAQDILSTDGEDVKDVSEAVTMAVTSHLSTNGQGRLRAMIPTMLPMSLGGGLGGEAGHEVGRQVEACQVRSLVFQPSHSYMDKVMRIPSVVDYLKSSWVPKSLYVIVGVATAQSLAVVDKSHRKLGGDFQLHAEAPGVMSGEAGLKGDKSSEEEVTYTMDHEAVFAYRAREFQFSRFRKTLKDRGHVTDGTMFGKESSANHETDGLQPEEYDFEFEDFLDGDSDDDDGDEEGVIEITE